MEKLWTNTKYVTDLKSRLKLKSRELSLLKVQQLFLQTKAEAFEKESDILAAQLKFGVHYEIQSKYHVAYSKYVCYQQRLERCDKKCWQAEEEFSDLMFEKTLYEFTHNIRIDIALPPPASWPPQT